jgi:hypothetical protein
MEPSLLCRFAGGHSSSGIASEELLRRSPRNSPLAVQAPLFPVWFWKGGSLSLLFLPLFLLLFPQSTHHRQADKPLTRLHLTTSTNMLYLWCFNRGGERNYAFASAICPPRWIGFRPSASFLLLQWRTFKSVLRSHFSLSMLPLHYPL